MIEQRKKYKLFRTGLLILMIALCMISGITAFCSKSSILVGDSIAFFDIYIINRLYFRQST